VESRKDGQSLRFIGQSQITSPTGDILIRATENDEELSVAEINPLIARNKSLNALNDLFKDRRPEMYNI
jgi:beta-ureidopropionase